jgi:ferric-dicitrate binding protein FerR (iron transport regulator)
MAGTGAVRAADPAGRVDVVSGLLSARSSKTSRELSARDPIFIGDRVATAQDARATLLLGEATTVKLGERARLTVDRFITAAGGTITLGAGALLLDRTPGPGNGPIEIRNAYGLIAVRGTQLYAGPSRGVFGVFVVRGSVTVRAAGREVTLAAGEGTDMARPGAPPSAPRRWAQERINAALARVN